MEEGDNGEEEWKRKEVEEGKMVGRREWKR